MNETSEDHVDVSTLSLIKFIIHLFISEAYSNPQA